MLTAQQLEARKGKSNYQSGQTKGSVMLSPEQIAARKGRLTASRIACLMVGDREKVMRLYEEMIGVRQEERLDHIWAVRLGEATETLQCDWFQEKYGLPVTRRGEVVVHPKYEWAACTLDGFIEE